MTSIAAACFYPHLTRREIKFVVQDNNVGVVNLKESCRFLNRAPTLIHESAWFQQHDLLIADRGFRDATLKFRLPRRRTKAFGGEVVAYDRVNVFQKLAFSDATALADVVIEEFTSGRASCVDVIYNEFKSVMQQRVVVEQLLPLAAVSTDEAAESAPTTEYLYEPSPQRIFDALIQRLVEAQREESSVINFLCCLVADDGENRIDPGQPADEESDGGEAEESQPQRRKKGTDTPQRAAHPACLPDFLHRPDMSPLRLQSGFPVRVSNCAASA